MEYYLTNFEIITRLEGKVICWPNGTTNKVENASLIIDGTPHLLTMYERGYLELMLKYAQENEDVETV